MPAGFREAFSDLQIRGSQQKEGFLHEDTANCMPPRQARLQSPSAFRGQFSEGVARWPACPLLWLLVCKSLANAVPTIANWNLPQSSRDFGDLRGQVKRREAGRSQCGVPGGQAH